MLGSAAPVIEAEDARILRRTRFRLMTVSGLVTAVILVVLGGATYLTAAELLKNNSETIMHRAADAYIWALQNDPRPIHRAMAFGDELSSLAAEYIPPAGTPQALGGPDPGNQAVDQASLRVARSGGTDLRETTITGESGPAIPVRVLSVPAGSGAVVQVIQDRTSEIHFLSTLLSILVGASLLALLLAVLAGYFYAGRALVPIRASMTRREAALNRQREFAANASHELRTPLTVIGASVEDLKRNRRSRVADVGEALEDIDAEVKHMTALVEDLLLLARTDSGVVQVEKIPLDLADIAVEAVSMLTSVAEEKQVRLELDPLPVFVPGDPLRLRQLVTILTDNAIKHTPPGSTVRVHVHPDSGAAILRVDDEGPGVREDDLPRLFERFWRADDAPAGGTGLGLSIAKWIVEQHGGVIGVYNRSEGGATFWARLPLPASAATTGVAADAAHPLDPIAPADLGAQPASPDVQWASPAADVEPKAD